jgi:hypothetical protein
MYLLIILLILGLVWYRRRVSGYDTKVIDKVKVKPLPNEPKPRTPRKTPKRDFTKVKEHPDLKKFQRQTAQYKAVVARQKAKEQSIVRDSARKIALERNRGNREASRIQRQGTSESRGIQLVSGREVRAINLRGNIEAARIKTAGNKDANAIKNKANSDAANIRFKAVRESATTVRNAKSEAQKIKDNATRESRLIRADGIKEAMNIKNKGAITAANIRNQKIDVGGVGTSDKYRYVLFARTKKSMGDHYLNLAEIQVYSGSTNVAQGKTVTSSSEWPGYPARHLTDGNLQNMAHTQNGNYEYFKIDLGGLYTINAVVIVNRVDGWKHRLEGTYVVLNDIDSAKSGKRLTSRRFTKEEAKASVITWIPGEKSCPDQNKWCASWAARGECTKNPRYMLNSCKTSCKVDGCHQYEVST